MNRFQKSLTAAAGFMWLGVLAACAGAQAAERPATYPTKSVRVVVPFSPGGSNDIMARLLGQKLTETFGQQFIVDNRPGASGIIGTTIAANATPDGHTLLVMSLTLAVNPSLHRKLPYDTEKDLAPITLIAAAPLMLVVHPSLPVKSTQEFIAYAKANPGKLNFGSGGPGSTPEGACVAPGTVVDWCTSERAGALFVETWPAFRWGANSSQRSAKAALFAVTTGTPRASAANM